MAMTMREISAEILKGMEGCNITKSTIKRYTMCLDKLNKQAETNHQAGLYSKEAIENVLGNTIE